MQSKDNGGRRCRLSAIIPDYLRVELLRLQILLDKRELGEVVEVLMDVYHASPQGDPELWSFMKGYRGGKGQGAPTGERGGG